MLSVVVVCVVCVCVVCVLCVQLEREFEQALKKSRGMVIHRMKPDGACLFRAVGEYSSYYSSSL